MASACNETVAQWYANYYQTDDEIWQTATCGTLFSPLG